MRPCVDVLEEHWAVWALKVKTLLSLTWHSIVLTNLFDCSLTEGLTTCQVLVAQSCEKEEFIVTR